MGQGAAGVAQRISRIVAIGLLALLEGCGGGGGSSPPPPDTTPSAFSFSNQTGAALSAVVTSNPIVISGIDSNAPVSITGGEYSIAGGPFTAAAGVVSNNQPIQVRVTSATQFSTTTTAVLTVGGVSVSFTVTTLDTDTTPDAFQFQRRTNATRDAWVESDRATISGINVAAPISIENGEYAIDGGAFTSAPGSISAGQHSPSGQGRLLSIRRSREHE